MHQVLLLDDLLRQILEVCPTEWLPNVARTCRSWKEPALDILWSNLRSLVPLLALIPGLVFVDGKYNIQSDVSPDLAVFHSYARRVKNITQRQTLNIHPHLLSVIPPKALSRLVSTRLASLDSQSLPAALSFSSNLRQLDVDFGFKRLHTLDGDQFTVLAHVAPYLERLRLRGIVDPRLNLCISQMSQLRSLILKTGPFLTVETLMAISTFSRLNELNIYAGHLPDPLDHSMWASDESFHSLQHLRISASGEFLRTFMTLTQSAHLHTLHLEASDSADWTGIFSSIGDSSTQTLHEMIIEDGLDNIEHLEIIPLDADTNTKSTLNRPRITIASLRQLSRFKHLQKLVIDTAHPADLDDEDIIELAALRCWPELLHLDFGSVLSFECLPRECLPRTTGACLPAIAKNIPGLKTLSLPMDVQSIPQAVHSPGSLTRILISSPTPPDPARMASYLISVFPSLVEVEGADEEHADIWTEVEACLAAGHIEFEPTRA